MKVRAVTLGIAALTVVALAQAGSAQARPLRAVRAMPHHRLVSLGTNQSSNWSGYNLGSVALGNKLFNEVSATWVVPRATAHKAGEAEFSSTWVGIGGGCVDANCQTTDSSLIQAGTEQDVDNHGVASYSAWWELIPAPSMTISGMTVSAGDVMFVDVKEVAADSNVWTFTVKDLTRHETFTQTQPYSSTHLTAEFIEETPVSVSNSGAVSIGPLPKLTTVHFDKGTVNGASAGLTTAEELQLSSGATVATPSAPDPDKDGFNDCAYAKACAAPRSS